MCLGELLREEQRLETQAHIGVDFSSSGVVNVAYAAKERGKGSLQCFYCKGYGHIARNCPQKVCNYCKQSGHFIKDCPTRPPKRTANAFQADVQSITPTVQQASTSQNAVTP